MHACAHTHTHTQQNSGFLYFYMHMYRSTKKDLEGYLSLRVRVKLGRGKGDLNIFLYSLTFLQWICDYELISDYCFFLLGKNVNMHEQENKALQIRTLES